ncbi:uncharacterized protein LOC110367014 isoform X4 [Fundulus heteroclitus]|nr:uncharacterized protein LOC110367014 isoform X4 [Fundulus heteroclitus]
MVKDDLTGREQLFSLSPESADNEANTTTEPPGTVPAVRDTSTTPLNLWLYIVVTIGLVALITTVVMLMVWIKREDEKSKMLEDVELNLNSTAVLSDPETSPDMANPEDDVSYATICHAKNAKRKTRDAEEDPVTYSSVKVHSAGAPPDPDSLCATIHKSNEEYSANNEP